MAGPYVHYLATREALKNLYDDDSFKQYRIITNPDPQSRYFPYVCLGSVSPDFPYPALQVGINSKADANKWTWGDKFHKEKTGSFVYIGVQALRGEPDKTAEAFLKKAAWLMGYYSHVITDLIVHAVVYKLVGGCYETHKHDHLHCEVVQDSMLFKDVYSDPPKELIDERCIVPPLEQCQILSNPDPTAPQVPTYLPRHVLDPDIEDFWDFILSQNYPDFYTAEPPNIDDWHRLYTAVMIVGTTVVARAVEPGMAYHRTDDITKEEKARFYSNITLPEGTKGADYKDAVFDKAVDEATQRLKTFLTALDTDSAYDSLQAELGQWNLDKGTADGGHPQFALWKGQTEWPFDCPGDPPVAQDKNTEAAASASSQGEGV